MKTNEEMKEIVNSMKITPRAEIVNADDYSKIYLSGRIAGNETAVYYESDDLITPKVVRSLIDEVEKDQAIELHINSAGGDVYASIEISNYFKDLPNKIHVVVDSIAASGASIIAMAGDKVSMYPNAMMMIHRASTTARGNAEFFEKVAADLKKFDEVVRNSYLDRFKGSKEELQAMINDETYLTAEDCIVSGLADEIIETQKEVAEGTADVKNDILNRFYNEQKSLLDNFKKEND